MRSQVLSELHPMADLLASCPGMTKEHVYYLEQRGYLRPIKQRHGKVERNLYTTEQLELVTAIWRHRQEGLSPRAAYQQAMQDQCHGQLTIWPEAAGEATQM